MMTDIKTSGSQIKSSRGYGISRGIEERTCGNSRVQLKKKQNFQGLQKKLMWNFHGWVLVFDFGISKGCHTILQNFQR